jgi:hypothetical protein
MSTLLAPIRRVIHQAAAEAADRELPKQVSDLITNAVSAAAGIADTALEIVRELTREPEAAAPLPGAAEESTATAGNAEAGGEK